MVNWEDFAGRKEWGLIFYFDPGITYYKNKSAEKGLTHKDAKGKGLISCSAMTQRSKRNSLEIRR
jgi:hypothetical protein